MPKASAKHDRDDVLQRLRTQLDALERRLHEQADAAWPADVRQSMANQARQLQRNAEQAAPEWGPAFESLVLALQDIETSSHPLDKDMTRSILGAAEAARNALPSPNITNGRGDGAALTRAEYPPPGYWRRWGGDAPEATPVLAEPSTPSEPVAAPAAVESRRPTRAQPAPTDAPYRVLIVEDDPSQALFAESVLVGSGMQARLVMTGDEVMGAMQEFRPELVLMDLHMPGVSGIDLTALIRERPEYHAIPIVFLTGDPDPEKQYEVLELGADDFLSKPIRPRHLIAAVQNRVMRTRAARQAATATAAAPAPRVPGGLATRAQMIEAIGAALAAERPQALFFVEIEGVPAMRERFGYAALEQLLTDAARLLGNVAAPHLAARINDNSFLVLAADLAEQAQADFARTLRDGLGRQPLPAGDQTVRLRALVGYTTVSPDIGDTGTAVATAERALREARSAPAGIAGLQPTPQTEQSGQQADGLRQALADGRFELAYQPVVAVAGGDEVQYQVLLRMRGEDDTLLPAAHILPLAEAADLLHEIDRFVLERAIETIQRAEQEGRALRLFVSQSPRSVLREGYAQAMLGTVEASGINGQNLVIDIRQDDALIHAVSLREFGSALVPTGVQLCLSQFSSTPESNSLLSQLPLGFVRLSARYSNALNDAAVRDSMRGAIDAAHRMGLQVIGPQVEDPQAAATLWMSGIDYIQGNLVQGATGAMDFDFQHSVL